MNVQDLILADYAAANEGNKFTLVGAGFDEIYTGSLPYTHRLMFVLVRLRITIEDIGRNRIEVRLVGERGSTFRVETDLEINENHQREQHCVMPIALTDLRFETAGEYQCEVLINGQVRQSHPLRIRSLEGPTPGYNGLEASKNV